MPKWAYYNENNAFAAQWLRNLIAAGHIAPGEVDERSIAEVTAEDVRGFAQAHFFAGIGVWSLALRSAGWADDRPVWTGSCPCQPFSGAGKQRGFADERHLWPVWFRLIEECHPPVVFGEQVCNPGGRAWFAAVRADLEGAGYAVGGLNSCAASVGAPHIRQRLFFVAEAEPRPVAHPNGAGLLLLRRGGVPGEQDAPQWHDSDGRGEDVGMGDPSSSRGGWDGRAVPGAQAEGRGQRQQAGRVADIAELAGAAHVLGHTVSQGPQIRPEPNDGRGAVREQVPTAGATGTLVDPWGDVEWIVCSDGKARPTQPRICPLAPGTPGRVGQLRAYGNSIVAPVATAFIQAYLDTLD